MFLLLQELYASLECVYHVSEQVFSMSPVYTEGWLAPTVWDGCQLTKKSGGKPTFPTPS